MRSELGRIFGETRREELKNAVVIPTFLLDDEGAAGFPAPSEPHWKPKIFHNLAGGDQDHGLCRDIALYTSAAPTYLPSAGSYIDGGVFANNPAMCAVAQMLDPRNAAVVDYQYRQIMGRKRYQRVQLRLDRKASMDNARAVPRMNELVARVPDAEVQSWAAWIDQHWLNSDK